MKPAKRIRDKRQTKLVLRPGASTPQRLGPEQRVIEAFLMGRAAVEPALIAYRGLSVDRYANTSSLWLSGARIACITPEGEVQAYIGPRLQVHWLRVLKHLTKLLGVRLDDVLAGTRGEWALIAGPLTLLSWRASRAPTVGDET